MIAVSHPGKNGDALYSLPTVRWITEKMNTKADFYTSEYCRPLIKLVEHQSYIHRVYVPPNYEIEHRGAGVQPWRMPIDSSEYEKVIHLGFRSFPNRPLHEFIAVSVGVPVDEIEIKYDYIPKTTFDQKYVVVAPKGKTGFTNLMLDFFDACPIKVVQIGARGEALEHIDALDATGLDMLDTLPWIANSVGFVGFLSSQMVLANGFSIPRVAVCPERGWRRDHVPRTELNSYLINPTVEQILEALKL